MSNEPLAVLPHPTLPSHSENAHLLNACLRAFSGASLHNLTITAGLEEVPANLPLYATLDVSPHRIGVGFTTIPMPSELQTLIHPLTLTELPPYLASIALNIHLRRFVLSHIPTPPTLAQVAMDAIAPTDMLPISLTLASGETSLPCWLFLPHDTPTHVPALIAQTLGLTPPAPTLPPNLHTTLTLKAGATTLPHTALASLRTGDIIFLQSS